MKAKLFLVGMVIALIGVVLSLHRLTNPPPPKEEPTPPPKSEARACLDPGRVAIVKTSKGEFKFVLYEKDMPVTCKNFIGLASKDFYSGLKFHRVEHWVVQTGDPKGDGTGGSGKTIELETKPGLGFADTYMVGMARKGDDPNSATSQFFVNKLSVPEISYQYASFGRVFEGQKIVDKLLEGDMIKEITVSSPSAEDLAKISALEWSEAGAAQATMGDRAGDSSHQHGDQCDH